MLTLGTHFTEILFIVLCASYKWSLSSVISHPGGEGGGGVRERVALCLYVENGKVCCYGNGID